MNANMYCDIPKQSMIPSLWKLGHRAVFQHNDPQTHLQDDHCLAKETEGKGAGLAKYVSRSLIDASLVHPQTGGEGVQGL